MKTIVVGTDGSDGAVAAMRWAACLAERHGAEVVVMTGFRPTEEELATRRYEPRLAECEAQLESWSEAARLGDVVVRTVVEEADPRPGLLAVAEREGADLIVVGRVGSSAGPGLFRMGSVVEWLAHHTEIPMAVIDAGAEVTTASVLVGVDGSDGSRSAVRFVRKMASDADVRIVAATVEQPYLEWTPASSPDNWRRRVEQEIREDFAAELVEAGADLDVLALRGSNVAGSLLEAAQDRRSDLVVVGMRGVGGFSGLRVGGVALKILHRADRPVVLVPRSSSETAA